MPSPFPGMDPYLEGPRWLGLHNQLVPEFARQLSPKLLPRYYAETTEPFVFAEPEDVAISAFSDVSIRSLDTADSSETAAVAVAGPVPVTAIMPEAIPHYAVEIRDIANRQLVTAIELLSPANKQGEGYHEYLRKRRRILTSSAHLLEIDLLRRGQRVPTLDPLPPAAYYVFLSRTEKRPVLDVWPIGLRDPLPRVPVPLLPGDDDVELDLQAAFTTVYDVLGYRHSTDYSGRLPVPLHAADQTWCDERLRIASLRS